MDRWLPARPDKKLPATFLDWRSYRSIKAACAILESEEKKLEEITSRNKSEKQAMLDNFVRKTLNKDLRDVWDRAHDEKLSYEWINRTAELPVAEQKRVDEKDRTAQKALTQRVKYIQGSLNDPKSANALLFKATFDDLASTKQRHDQTEFVLKVRRDRDEARAALMHD